MFFVINRINFRIMWPVFRHWFVIRSENVHPQTTKRARVFGSINLPVNHQKFIESEIVPVYRTRCGFERVFGVMTYFPWSGHPPFREIVGSVWIFDISQFLRAIRGYKANPDIFGFKCFVMDSQRINFGSQFEPVWNVLRFVFGFWNLNDFRLPCDSLCRLIVFFREVIQQSVKQTRWSQKQ